MRYPPGWRLARGDRGTATAVLTGPGEAIAGYLNLTPRQGAETLANWPEFRLEHNRMEGDRDLQRLSSATNLVFPTGRGSCVEDSYTTRSGARYTEIACLISGRRSGVVVVGAAPPALWPRERGDLARAVAGVTA